MLCDIARVSLSGYYSWRKKLFEKSIKEDREKENIETLKIYCQTRKKGYRRVTMELYKDGIPMNHKKVLRLMKKYGLLSKIRKRNPYKQITKKTEEHRSMANILQRNFSWITPLEKLWTDISYLYYSWTKAYISILKDMITGEIISHKISQNLSLWFVLDTIQNAKKILQRWSLEWHYTWSIIQSDQWWHYTHPSYQKLLKENWFIQSMSRKRNCLDNAPTESFFGHMKDELEYTHCKTFSELQEYCDQYIQYYNTKRPQWERKKMTPVEYRNHLLEISKQKHIV